MKVKYTVALNSIFGGKSPRASKYAASTAPCTSP